MQKSPEYEYEYYSVFKKHQLIWFSNIFGPNYSNVFDYPIICSPLMYTDSNIKLIGYAFNAATPQPLLIINEHNFPGSKMKSAGPSSSLTWTTRGRLSSRRSSTLSRSPPSPPLFLLFNQSELEGGLGDLGRPGRLDWWNRRWDLQLPLREAHCSRTDRGEIITELSTTKKWYSII